MLETKEELDFPPSYNEAMREKDTLDPIIITNNLDYKFCTSFFIAFIFDWIGLLLLICLCPDFPSRCGAFAGFGLSLTKWIFIIEQSFCTFSKENIWLYWLTITLGVIISISSTIRYFKHKHKYF